ncbi:MAG: MFS transporter [Anaerolineales bacterium]|nr:MFS transporter [Anaerolineales bacterium]
MFTKIKFFFKQYPNQYWLMTVGVIVSTMGGSMVWPFMLIYASEKLNLQLSAAAMLISIYAATGLFASLLAGALADKIGRKAVMVFSLAMTGLSYFLLMKADTYPEFVALMILIGFSNPLYQVGADAMLADMIPSEKRSDAYSINRIANNAAFALGPAVGGFLASTSYTLAFYAATSGFLTYSALMLVFAKETLQKNPKPVSLEEVEAAVTLNQDGFLNILKDKSYMAFTLLMGIGLTAPTMLWVLMPVYAKTNFNINEALYGWIPTTNAIMCVFLQYAVTQITRKHHTLPVTAIGMFIYAVSVGSVALMTNFWGFLLSMVILTFGELTIVPTASKYVADISPAHLRGRYMSVYWFGWGLARTLSPLIGGYLNDAFSPQAIWIGGLALGLISSIGIFALASASKTKAAPLLADN